MNALQNSIYSESIRRELRARQRWYATHGKNLRIPAEVANHYGTTKTNNVTTQQPNYQQVEVPQLNFALLPHPPQSLPVQMPLAYTTSAPPLPPTQLNTVPMSWRAPRPPAYPQSSNHGAYTTRVVLQDELKSNQSMFSRSAPIASSSSSVSSHDTLHSVSSTPPSMTVLSLPFIPVNADFALHSQVPLPHDHAMYQKSVRTHTSQVGPFDEAEHFGYLTMNLPTHLYKPPSTGLTSPVVVTHGKKTFPAAAASSTQNSSAENNNQTALWPTPPATVRVPVELVRYIPLDDRDKDGEKGHFLAKSLGYGPNHRNYYRYIRDNREGQADVALFRTNHVN